MELASNQDRWVALIDDLIGDADRRRGSFKKNSAIATDLALRAGVVTFLIGGRRVSISAQDEGHAFVEMRARCLCKCGETDFLVARRDQSERQDN